MMSKPSIDGLAARLDRVQAKRKAILESAVRLEAKLNAAFAGTGVFGCGADVTLEKEGPCVEVYGRLCYSTLGLTAQYRDSTQDEHDDYYKVPVEERDYTVKGVDQCSPQWIDRLLSEEHVSSLLANLDAWIDGMEGAADRSLAVLQNALATESVEIEAQMAASLVALNREAVSRNWQAALDATHLDTADALTRATTMLESVCAAILIERGIPLPKDKSLSPLLKECVNSLGLPDLPELQPDLKQLLGGVASICGGAAALRTHFGTAHGATSHFAPLDAAFCELAKNTCAAAAIFLIDRHKHGGGSRSVDGKA